MNQLSTLGTLSPGSQLLSFGQQGQDFYQDETSLSLSKSNSKIFCCLTSDC